VRYYLLRLGRFVSVTFLNEATRQGILIVAIQKGASRVFPLIIPLIMVLSDEII
jgi:hypothetical protein